MPDFHEKGITSIQDMLMMFLEAVSVPGPRTGFYPKRTLAGFLAFFPGVTSRLTGISGMRDFRGPSEQPSDRKSLMAEENKVGFGSKRDWECLWALDGPLHPLG